MGDNKSELYRQAGVDIDAADRVIDAIRPLADATRIPGATRGIGGFGGLFDLQAAGFKEAPQLVAGADGVGTKLKVAFLTGIHDTIGIDCVAMCVNDIITTGARPLFFLDYLATGALDEGVAEAVVRGVAEGCRRAHCWLLGGETAEMPGLYAEGEYDLAGFAVGAIPAGHQPATPHDGDPIVAVASSGVHSNGFSLARKVLFEIAGLGVRDHLDGDSLPLGERLLVPTRIYVDALGALEDAGVAMAAPAHITGGGLWENPHRGLPGGLAVELQLEQLERFEQPIFRSLQDLGSVARAEMYRVFNMGVGLTFVTGEDHVDSALDALRAIDLEASVIGRVVATDGEPGTTIVGLDA